MANNFPMYSTHEVVNCFNCGGPTANVQDTGYPPKGGQFRQTCRKCGMHTYYDIRGAEFAPLTREFAASLERSNGSA